MFCEAMYPLYLHGVNAKCRSKMASESGVNMILLRSRMAREMDVLSAVVVDVIVLSV